MSDREKMWDSLTTEQQDAINNFIENPPKYYKWFYKFYKKFLGSFIFFGILATGILMAIFQDAIFEVVKVMFFILFGTVMWSASAYIYKHLYTKKYAKKVGMSLQQWNFWTRGLTFKV